MSELSLNWDLSETSDETAPFLLEYPLQQLNSRLRAPIYLAIKALSDAQKLSVPKFSEAILTRVAIANADIAVEQLRLDREEALRTVQMIDGLSKLRPIS